MKLSIIICSYKRSGFLSKLIQDILEKEPDSPDLEYILVLQQYAENDLEQVKELINNSFAIITDQGSGLSRARNLGIKKAQGTYIAFWDDDIRLPEALTPIILNAFLEKKMECFTGIELPIFSKKKPSWYQDKLILQDYEKSVKFNKVYLHGSMMCFSKKLMDKAGNFHNFFGPKGTELDYGDDSYMEYKVRQLGIKVHLESRLKYQHDKTKLLNLRTLLYASYKKGKASTHLKIRFNNLNLHDVFYLIKSWMKEAIFFIFFGMLVLQTLGLNTDSKKRSVYHLNRITNYCGSLHSIVVFKVFFRNPQGLTEAAS